MGAPGNLKLTGGSLRVSSCWWSFNVRVNERKGPEGAPGFHLCSVSQDHTVGHSLDVVGTVSEKFCPGNFGGSTSSGLWKLCFFTNERPFCSLVSLSFM